MIVGSLQAQSFKDSQKSQSACIMSTSNRSFSEKKKQATLFTTSNILNFEDPISFHHKTQTAHK